jgi:AcrR family transcriptional regulator
VRIVKEYEERKAELLDTALRLFISKGYEQTSINDILNEVGISKGTFYYYFKSKEQLLEVMAARHADRRLAVWNEWMQDRGIDAVEKLNRILQSAGCLEVLESGAAVAQLKEAYGRNNHLFRREMYKALIEIAGPELAKIVEQGRKEGAFNTRYPRESIGLIIALGESALEQLAGYTADCAAERHCRPEAMRTYLVCQDAMERILGAKSGSVQFLLPELFDSLIGELDAAADEASINPR